MKLGFDEGGVLGGEEVEVEGLEECVAGVGGALEDADVVAAGEGGGRHETTMLRGSGIAANTTQPQERIASPLKSNEAHL
ncbi:hypothetical protein LR48_Vigan07g068600 [Vigna angularis]|uniref:Uncharacterized protein n=1 Tax=Phaseolus angularis TaxID=3914 RepID=A0A0L9UWP3_PHAAN|nr:hypothetical protein LR48_Vigan07g068600 [Vigna angularis]